MYCKKCGKPIADDSVFCSYCGASVEQITNSANVKGTGMSVNTDNNKTKKTVIIIVAIVLLVVGFFSINGVIQQKRADREMQRLVDEIAAEVKHKFSFVGTYENSIPGSGHIKLELNSDNTAVMYLGDEKYSRIQTYKGHWTESYDDIIELAFTRSFHMFGSEYNTTAYLKDNTLWQSITAIRAKDYLKAEYLSKLDSQEKNNKEQPSASNTSSEEGKIKEFNYFKDKGYIPIEEGALVLYKELKEGVGRNITTDETVVVNYEMRNAADSTLLDEGKEVPLSPTAVISGLKKSMIHMKAGSKWSIFIPYLDAFGSTGQGDIQPYTNLLLTVEIVSLKK